MKGKVFGIGILLVILLFSSLTMGIEGGGVHKNSVEKKSTSNFEKIVESNGVRYTTHDVIRINNDKEFAQIAQQEGWTGNGSQSNPYIISGYDIDAHGAGDAIYIGNTTVYFVVKDCYLHNASSHRIFYVGGDGIMLYNVKNGNIKNNIIRKNGEEGINLCSSNHNMISNNICISNNETGIYLSESRNNVISRNNCSDNGDGVYLDDHSNNNIVSINNCNNNYYGVVVGDASHNVISSNICNNNSYGGIYLPYSSAYNVIKSNNLCNNGHEGIFLGYSINNKLYRNRLINNGIVLLWNKSTFTMQEIPTNNTVNGKPVYYYKNVNMNNALVPSDAGQVILGGVSYLKIENLKIENASIAIEVGFSSHITISNNSCSHNRYGIYLHSSENNLISKNNCNNNNYGIYLDDYSIDYSNNNVISANICRNNFDSGIILDHSSNNAIKNNNCSNNAYGIRLQYSRNNVISNNICINNAEGILLSHSINNMISNNKCNYNGDGVYLYYSDNNVIRNNIFNSNAGYGVYIHSGSNNLIYNNSFLYNNDSMDTYNFSSIQADDDGKDNHWNSSSGTGNYWLDWTNQPDNNMDGIVDEPYLIDGSGNARDFYPLKNPPKQVSGSISSANEGDNWVLWIIAGAVAVGVIIGVAILVLRKKP